MSANAHPSDAYCPLKRKANKSLYEENEASSCKVEHATSPRIKFAACSTDETMLDAMGPRIIRTRRLSSNVSKRESLDVKCWIFTSRCKEMDILWKKAGGVCWGVRVPSKGSCADVSTSLQSVICIAPLMMGADDGDDCLLLCIDHQTSEIFI